MNLQSKLNLITAAYQKNIYAISPVDDSTLITYLTPTDPIEPVINQITLYPETKILIKPENLEQALSIRCAQRIPLH